MWGSLTYCGPPIVKEGGSNREKNCNVPPKTEWSLCTRVNMVLVGFNLMWTSVGAGPASWTGGDGGQVFGDTSLSQASGFIYGNGSTTCIPNPALINSVPVIGYSICGGYDHEISRHSASSSYRANTATLAGSSDCPPSTPHCLAVVAEGTHLSQHQLGSPVVGGSTAEPAKVFAFASKQRPIPAFCTAGVHNTLAGLPVGSCNKRIRLSEHAHCYANS